MRDNNLLAINRRLIIIKNAIFLQDFETINLQMKKLEGVNTNIIKILDIINAKDFDMAIMLIDDFITNGVNISLYVDKELEVLKLSLQNLKSELTELNLKKEEYLKIVSDFNYEYAKHVGYLIAEILKLKKEKLENDAKQNDELKDEFENAKQEEDDFKKFFEDLSSKQIKELNEDEKIYIKDAYRQASKLCHPDILDEPYKEKATKVFQELNTAYQNSDIGTVQKILDELQNGFYFENHIQEIADKDKLKAQIKILENDILNLKNEIDMIANDEAYLTATTIEDKKQYFDNLKTQLEKELNELKSQINTWNN